MLLTAIGGVGGLNGIPVLESVNSLKGPIGVPIVKVCVGNDPSLASEGKKYWIRSIGLEAGGDESEVKQEKKKKKKSQKPITSICGEECAKYFEPV